MIHIFFGGQGNGPGKVSKNLILGLNKLGIDFKINTNINEIPQKDKIISLQNTNIMYTDFIGQSIIGPNICILPIENSVVMNQKYKKMIVPSEWVKNKYLNWLPENKLFIWAVGIDTETFKDFSKTPKNNDCLIYFKNRNLNDLNKTIDFLNSKKQSYQIIEYGKYNENYFINTIKNSKYGIVIANTESQGIAIQEMMSCNLPLLVWDFNTWDGMGPNYLFPATTVPYWDEKCGIKFNEFYEIESIFTYFIDNIKNFSPREYILANLTLEKKALDIINVTNE